MLKISVVIPSFNNGNYIKYAIDSFFKQSYENKELIVIDNNSSDDTENICRSYGDSLTYIRESDKGQYDAINKGLQLSTGDIFAYINCDDYYNFDFFRDISKYFEDTSVNLVYGNCVVKSDTESFVLYPPRNISRKKLLTYGNLMYQPSSFFRKDVLLSFGGCGSYYYMMEYDMFLKVLKTGRAVYINKDISTFVLHRGQKSESKNQHKIADEVIDIMLKHGGSKLSPLYIGNLTSRILPYKYISLIKSALIKMVP